MMTFLISLKGISIAVVLADGFMGAGALHNMTDKANMVRAVSTFIDVRGGFIVDYSTYRMRKYKNPEHMTLDS